MTKFGVWTRSILAGLLSAIAYGILHDQISVRICAEYLTVWHPSIVGSDNPTIVALAWGVFATWWFGLILGIGLAFGATIGSHPPAPWKWMRNAILAIFATAAIAAGIATLIAKITHFEVPQYYFGEIFPENDHLHWQAFSQVAAMHEASYIAAAVATGIAAITLYVLRRLHLFGSARSLLPL